MKFILVDHIKVQNANAIAGFTWGFPAITHFLGFAHNLSRKILNTEFQDIMLSGCGVVCHEHQIHIYGSSNNIQFVQSRNPAYLKKDADKLAREGKTPSVIEEGKMNMTVSLLIGCDGNIGNRKAIFIEWLRKQCMLQRLAGGTVLSIGEVEVFADDNDSLRQLKFKLLPGFVLQDRSSELEKHYSSLEQQDPNAELLDAWLDFASLKHKARPKSDIISDYFGRLVRTHPENSDYNELFSIWEKHLAHPYGEEEIPDRLVNHFGGLEDTKGNKTLLDQWQNYCQPTEKSDADWEYVPKPASGYLVPIMTGYKAISKVYANEEVQNTRDNETDVCFVEAVHSVGEWQSVHRLNSTEELRKCLWYYHCEDNWYLCKQQEENRNVARQNVEYEEDFS